MFPKEKASVRVSFVGEYYSTLVTLAGIMSLQLVKWFFTKKVWGKKHVDPVAGV